MVLESPGSSLKEPVQPANPEDALGNSVHLQTVFYIGIFFCVNPQFRKYRVFLSIIVGKEEVALLGDVKYLTYSLKN